ncbi:MAG: hypothetical protein QXY47_05415 [Thermoplasmata archaeon]
MKTKTIKLKTYTFDELKDEVKEKVLEKYRDINVNYDGWHDFIIDDWKRKIENLGYENVKIYYSGFYSQGDGACFVATVNIEKWIKKHKAGRRFRKLLNEVRAGYYAYIGIKHNLSSWLKSRYRYNFSTSTDVVFYGDSELSEKAYKQLEEMVELIKEEREELGNEIYRDLEKEYNYLTSDEAIIETLIKNDYEFLEDGSRQIYI